MTFNAALLPLALTAALLGLLPAAASASDDTVFHDAHVHGAALLMLIQEGSEVAIELTSPAMNITGFEHYDGSDKQKAAIAHAIVLMEGADSLFSLKGGDCQLTSTSTDFTALTSEHDAHQGAHHDDHSDDHHDDHGEKPRAQHSDISAVFEFQCTEGETLSAIDVNLAAVFPGIHTLDVEWIVDGQQGSQTLTEGSDTRIQLRK